MPRELARTSRGESLGKLLQNFGTVNKAHIFLCQEIKGQKQERAVEKTVAQVESCPLMG